MKSTETIAAQGCAAAQEIFATARGDELGRIMDLGLPRGVFSGLAARAIVEKTAGPLFHCKFKVQPGLSGLKPRLFIDGTLTELQQVAAVAEGTFELARKLYHSNEDDRSDLDAWLSAGLRSEVRTVAPAFIAVYGDDRSMLKIGPTETPWGLGSFKALRRLVLKDG